jgi:hypothetical protein
VRAAFAVAVVLLAACNDGAIDLTLVFPEEAANYDMSCVKAVDVLTLGPNDTMSLDIGARTSSNVACVDLGHTVTTFAQVQAALTNKVNAAIPAGGLAAVELRGRAGSCMDKPAQFEAIFYGGAQDAGNADLTIPVARAITCDSSTQFTVKPVNMYGLFNTKTCADYIDASSQAFSADLRPTLIPRQPLVFEIGESTQPMSSATANIMSFTKMYTGTCTVIALQSSDGALAGQACINAGAATACAQLNLELALLPTAYAQMSRDTSITKYSGWNFIGVWTTSGTVGPVMDATVTVDNGDDAKVVYGDLGTTAFQPNAGAITTTPSGMVMVYTNAIVGVTVSATGKTSRHIYIGADAQHPSSTIAVIN